MKQSAVDKGDVYDAIYEIVRHIPAGKVTSYGAIAESIGLRSGARLVGFAMGQCQNVVPFVPAHRVVNSSGVLTGKFHFSPADRMQQLLEKEGVAVRNDKVVSFKEKFWDPKTELSL